MKTSYIVTAFLALAVASCKSDFLTVVPETALSSATFYKTEADFQQAVNGAYVPLRPLFNERAWVLEEMHSDNTYYARNILYGAVDPTENVADFAVPTAGGVTANDNVLWAFRYNYQIIARTNQLLSQIDGVTFSSEANKNNIKGQALFLRAFAYFDLVRLFGKVPLHLTPSASREDAALPSPRPTNCMRKSKRMRKMPVRCYSIRRSRKQAGPRREPRKRCWPTCMSPRKNGRRPSR